MSSKRVRPNEPNHEPEQDLERLSVELRDQVKLARDRIRDRYGKLMEPRSFENSHQQKA